jgi:hypothetical protein
MNEIDLPPFPIEALELNDLELGAQVLAWFVFVRAVELGKSLEDITEEFSEEIRKNILKLESSRAEDAAFEKALHKSASGDYVKAGKLMREILKDGAKIRKLENYVFQDKKRLSEARSAGGKAKAVNTREELGPRDEKIKNAYIELIKSGRAKREIPGILAKRFKLSAGRIRQICRGKSKNE